MAPVVPVVAPVLVIVVPVTPAGVVPVPIVITVATVAAKAEYFRHPHICTFFFLWKTFLPDDIAVVIVAPR